MENRLALRLVQVGEIRIGEITATRPMLAAGHAGSRSAVPASPVGA